MADTIISVENLAKRYSISHQVGKGDGLRHRIEDMARAPFRWLKNGGNGDGPARPAHEEFWALKDVSFEIKRGDVVGIIGRNGAGKSTLLKILSRIVEPTRGRVVIDGRVASLLEVGTGFHQELTGRENIFLNGAILGMSKVEIKRKFDEIVDFADIEKFLDTPVKRYSSGMYVRLAFAVAAHLEPEILIVDEVLAVGDAEFQRKCLGKMESVAQGQGRTVIFVSHNMAAVETLCRRGILLQNGLVAFDGESRQAITGYLSSFERPVRLDLDEETERSGSGLVRLRNVTLLSDGTNTAETVSGASVHFEFTYANPRNLKNAQFTFTIYTENGVAVTSINSLMLGRIIALAPASGVITCSVPRLPLNQGRYRVAVAIQDESGESYDHVPSALWFRVTGCKFYASGRSPDPRYSLVLTDHSWF